jgi:hypothetical protein
MITAREVSVSLFGAWRLAHLDAGGLNYFDRTETGFWRSFWAAALVAPIYALLIWVRVAETGVNAGPVRILLVESIGYAINWTAYPLAAWYAVQALGRGDRYFGYFCAYNWSTALLLCLFIPVAAINGLELLPKPITMLLGYVVTFAALFYHYFIARNALDIEKLPAIGLVAIDLIIGVFLQSFTIALETTRTGPLT